MTVVVHDQRNQYTATGGQTVFSYTFEIALNSNLAVYQRAAESEPDDAADLLTLTTDYTVTGVGSTNGGTIVLVSGATVGDIITIQGDVPVERDTSFTPNGVIRAEDLNEEFDNQTLIEQRILTYINKVIPSYPLSAVVSAFELVLPNLEENQVWQMNSDRTAIIGGTLLSAEDLASHASGLGASLIGLHPTGTVQDLANAPFILKTASATAPNAQVLGVLGTGILKNTTTTGVLSISTALTSLDNLASAADLLPYYNGSNSFTTTALTAFARTLLDDANATAAQTTLGLLIGTNVQAQDATLQSISALGTAANKMLYTIGVDTWAEADLSAFSRSLLDEADQAAWQTALGVSGGSGSFLQVANNLDDVADTATAVSNLGLTIGVNTQAYDATLQSLSALGTMADKIAYTTAVDTWAETAITSLGRDLIADATQADMNVTIGSLPLAGGTMTGALILSGDPTIGSQAATKNYVDAVSQNQQLACDVATEADMPTWVYNNGASGVGATLTAPANGASTFDGIVPVDGDRVLVLFQTTNPAWQGAYTIVQGTGGTPTVLTRATDWDVNTEMQAGDIFSVVAGTTYAASQWMFTQTGAITVGTTALTFAQITGQGALLRANNLSDLTNVATARTNLGLVIGTNVQAQDATLQSLSGLGTAADRYAYTTGIDTWVEGSITLLGRSLVAGANAAAMQSTLELVPGTNVQAYSAQLASFAALGTNGIIARTAANTITARTITAGSAKISIGNGDAVSGNPTVDLGSVASTDLSDSSTLVRTTRTISAAGIATGGGDLSSDRTITVTAAVKADQETATSTAVAVVPGVQQFHPSSAKAWAQISYSAGVPSATTSYNVSSITDVGTGQAQVNFTTAFSSNNFSAIPGKTATPALSPPLAVALLTTSVQVDQRDDAGTFSDINGSVVCYGDQ